jgi:hypothetical protein
MSVPHPERVEPRFDAYGNTPAGFEPLNARVSESAERAGRTPNEIERSTLGEALAILET